MVSPSRPPSRPPASTFASRSRSQAGGVDRVGFPCCLQSHCFFFLAGGLHLTRQLRWFSGGCQSRAARGAHAGGVVTSGFAPKRNSGKQTLPRSSSYVRYLFSGDRSFKTHMHLFFLFFFWLLLTLPYLIQDNFIFKELPFP